MAIVPVPTISLESVRAVSLGDTLREGQILEAKVTAMLTETLARLSIDGKTIDVATPKPLPPGATMTLKAEREGGQLRLVTQGPIRPAPETPQAESPDADMPSRLMEPLKALLSKVQAMAVDVASGRPPAGEATAPSSATAAFAALADEASASERTAGQTAAPLAVPPDEAGEAAPPGRNVPTQGASQGAAQGSEAPSQAGREPATAPGPRSAPAATPGALPQAATEQAAPSQSQSPQPQLPSSAMPPQAGVEPRQPQTIPARLQTLALEAAMSQRAAVDELLPQAPSAKPQAGGLEMLQAALAGTAADDLLSQDSGANTRPQAEARLHATGTVPHAPADSEAPDAPMLAAKIAVAAREAASEVRHAATPTAPLPDLAQPQAAVSDFSAAQARTERAAVHFTFDIPLYFPGNPQPLRLEVSQDDGDGEERDGENKPRSWTIRFAAEAGPLGMIHAAITQTGDQIGVQLWAERGETAALFKDSARQLQDSLEASNLKLEALKIAEGRPEERDASDAGRPSDQTSRKETL
jgi:hypothetical protein